MIRRNGFVLGICISIFAGGLAIILKPGLATAPLQLNTQTTEPPFYSIFLTNNQVYFGHIVEENDHNLVIRNVYYLEVATTPATAVTDQEEVAKLVTTSLKKIGTEPHSPKDEITINRDNVLYYQEMRNEGPIMEAIVKHEQVKE